MPESIELTLAIVAAVVLVVVNLVAVLMVVMQLPGTWVMLLAMAVYAIWRGGEVSPGVGLSVLGGMLLLAVLGELVEFAAGAAGARRAGGTKTAAALAVVGGIVGAVVGSMVLFLVGTIIGACIGAGAGSIVGDLLRGRQLRQAGIAARGAAVGKLWGTLAKIVVAVVMWFVATVALLMP